MDVTPIGDSHGGEDDVEEGEILDEEGLANVKTPDSDGESGEIKSDQFQGDDLVCSNRSSYVFLLIHFLFIWLKFCLDAGIRMI